MSQREEKLLVACTEMVGRTGAEHLQLRYSDDEMPVVWMAVAQYPDGNWEAAGAPTPKNALFRLLEVLVDGGRCTHCQRPTGVTEDLTDMLMDQLICWYQYDPELNTFRRACEGS